MKIIMIALAITVDNLYVCVQLLQREQSSNSALDIYYGRRGIHRRSSSVRAEAAVVQLAESAYMRAGEGRSLPSPHTHARRYPRDLIRVLKDLHGIKTSGLRLKI